MHRTPQEDGGSPTLPRPHDLGRRADGLPPPGWIEVICGSMFSGKTEELISRIRREIFARKPVRIFKPRTDDRYAVGAVVSHSSLELPCIAVDRASDILRFLDGEVSVVGIDECQFFGEELLPVVETLADRGLRVICAGLDQDYLGQPFDPMPHLMAVAEYVTKKLAVCMVCGNPANRSQRLTASETRVVIGATEAYEARCRRCFHPRDGAEQPALPMDKVAKLAQPERDLGRDPSTRFYSDSRPPEAHHEGRHAGTRPTADPAAAERE